MWWRWMGFGCLMLQVFVLKVEQEAGGVGRE